MFSNFTNTIEYLKEQLNQFTTSRFIPVHVVSSMLLGGKVELSKLNFDIGELYAVNFNLIMIKRFMDKMVSEETDSVAAMTLRGAYNQFVGYVSMLMAEEGVKAYRTQGELIYAVDDNDYQSTKTKMDRMNIFA